MKIWQMFYLLILDHRWRDKTRWTWCPHSSSFLHCVKNAKKRSDCHFFVLVFCLELEAHISLDYVCSCRRTVCLHCVVTGYCRLWNLTNIAVPDWSWTVFVPSMILPWIEWVLQFAAFLVSSWLKFLTKGDIRLFWGLYTWKQLEKLHTNRWV
jgi:hypothetical protein